jgi:hypothetical protein
MAWRESWWPQELPTEGELQEGLRNLERYYYEVDYVITHCCASTLQDRINAGTGRSCTADLLTDYLEILEQKESASAVPVPDQTEGEKDHGKG